MSISIEGNRIKLEGNCGIESVESLHQFLLDCDMPHLDLSACNTVHGALLQVLMAANIAVHEPPASPALRHLLASSGVTIAG